MGTFVRTGLILISVTQLLFALAFFFQWPLATAVWPFPGTTPLTYMFLASIFAAAAAATLWATLSEQYAALAGIGLDYLMILGPVAIFVWQLGVQTNSAELRAYAIACALGAAFGAWLLWWSLRFPLDRSIPLPAPIRWSFIVFITALLIVSTQLIFQVPNVLPWSITPELSVVIGWMFFGALNYFAYGLLRPGWANAGGQLAGFLAYDIVLMLPFLVRLPTVAPEYRLGLWIYTIVVLYSAALALFYLFVHPPTRLWRRQARLRV